MKASCALEVRDEMRMKIVLSMTVGEAEALRKALEDKQAWPVSDLRFILFESLQKAREAHTADSELVK